MKNLISPYVNRRFLLLMLSTLWLSLSSQAVLAHGVAEGDKGYKNYVALFVLWLILGVCNL